MKPLYMDWNLSSERTFLSFHEAGKFSFGTNLSLIQSRVDLDSLELAVNQSLNPSFSESRPFQGQSPYLVNANLNYFHPDLGLM